MFQVYITTEGFKNRSFTLKTKEIFSVHTKLDGFQNGGFHSDIYESNVFRPGVIKFLQFKVAHNSS